jgi:hypothetical protein
MTVAVSLQHVEQVHNGCSLQFRNSIVAFTIALIIGLMSLVAGYGIYYAVSFVLPVSIDSIYGNTLWPSTILAGTAWAIGFLIARFISARIKNRSAIPFVYLAAL